MHLFTLLGGFLLGLFIDLSVQAQPRYRVYLVHHGWHAGIAFCQKDLWDTLWPREVFFPERRFLEVGWGEAGYYPDPNPGVGDALRAALWPSRAVLHVAGFDDAPVQLFRESVRQLDLDAEAFRRLVAYVANYFARDQTGQVQRLQPGLYGRESFFYAARGRYHLFNNCNHWVARALRAAGLPVAPARALTVGDLWQQLEPLTEASTEEAYCK